MHAQVNMRSQHSDVLLRSTNTRSMIHTDGSSAGTPVRLYWNGLLTQVLVSATASIDAMVVQAMDVQLDRQCLL